MLQPWRTVVENVHTRYVYRKALCGRLSQLPGHNWVVIDQKPQRWWSNGCLHTHHLTTQCHVFLQETSRDLSWRCKLFQLRHKQRFFKCCTYLINILYFQKTKHKNYTIHYAIFEVLTAVNMLMLVFRLHTYEQMRYISIFRRQCVHPKFRYLSASPHSVTIQNTNTGIFTTIRTSNQTIRRILCSIAWQNDDVIYTINYIIHALNHEYYAISKI